MINGPNLNLLGTREPEVYGSATLKDAENLATDAAKALGHSVECFQSNHEGHLIDKIQSASASFDGIVLNAGGFTHTSVALRDAVASIDIPVVELHVSNIHAREEFRHTSLLSSVCAGLIIGFGIAGYALAVQALGGLIDGS